MALGHTGSDAVLGLKGHGHRVNNTTQWRHFKLQSRFIHIR